MKSNIIFGLVIFFLLIVANLPPMKYVLGYDDCKYSNGNASFTFEEINSNGRDFVMANDGFTEFKKMYKLDTTLYRLCPMNVLHVWKYWDYLSMKKYRLPYRQWKEIEPHRAAFGSVPSFQDF